MSDYGRGRGKRRRGRECDVIVEEEDEEDEDGGETTEWQTHWTDFLADGRAIIIANWTGPASYDPC
jgi:hypothetical protein